MGRAGPAWLGPLLRTILFLRASRGAAYIDHFLVRWAQRKYKRLRGHYLRAWAWLNRVKAKQPALFAHWSLVSAVGR